MFFLHVMEGTISTFRRGRHTQTTNQMIVVVNEIKNKDQAKDLIGKKVVWKSPAGKELIGKVTFVHGNKGAVRVLFETGMPGQSISEKVSIE